MASAGSKSVAFFFLFLNLGLYFIVTIIAAWAINHGMMRARESASVLLPPAHLFPIYFPMGSMATGFFVIFALIAGVVGMATSITGLKNILQWTAPNLHSAAAFSMVTWAITLLAMGLAFKEISLGWRDANLRTLEVIMVVVSATQFICTSAIHVGVEEVIAGRRNLGGTRV